MEEAEQALINQELKRIEIRGHALALQRTRTLELGEVKLKIRELQREIERELERQRELERVLEIDLVQTFEVERRQLRERRETLKLALEAPEA